MVMRDEMNCPIAETINKMSDQNLKSNESVRTKASTRSGKRDSQTAVDCV